MIRIDDLLVLTPKLTLVDALLVVIAAWKSDEELGLQLPGLRGHVVGPLCEYAETLSDRIPLRLIVDPKDPPSQIRAAARVFEPCFWEPKHPFRYELYLELRHGNGIRDMRRLVSGIRHLTVTRSELLLNGQEVFLNGVRHRPEATIEELDAWHEVDCTALLVAASEELCARTDRWGPMVLHVLPRTKEEARVHVVKLRNHPSVLIWVVPARINGHDLEEFLRTIKAHDPSRVIGQLVGVDELIDSASPVDMFFLPAGHWAIGSTKLTKPYAVLGDVESDPDISQFENFTNQTEEVRESLGSPPGLVGVIL